jgi:hypothetical protein
MTYPKGYKPPSAGGNGGKKSNIRRNIMIGLWIFVFIMFLIIIVTAYNNKTKQQNDMPSPTTESLVDSGNSNCDPSYPDFCIPSYPPDLDCPDISTKRFTVLSSDPHGFDRDGDGVGCES